MEKEAGSLKTKKKPSKPEPDGLKPKAIYKMKKEVASQKRKEIH